MIGIPLGLAYSNIGEWMLHKHVLHGLGKKQGSFWRFHWMDHHKNCRQNSFYDPDYQRSVFGAHAQGKEAAGLVALGMIHLPLLPVAPLFTSTVFYSLLNYYRKHKRAHMDPQWARKNLPWHWDHHMGPNPEANWCVTKPWFDKIVGTHEPSPGSE